MLGSHSCGHCNCPHCQHFECQRWIERQTRRLVAGSYFLVTFTFTLPGELRGLAWKHQRTVYDQMMQCAWETLRTFSQNHKQLQGSPGAVAVLHTHSRQLAFHPHVHVVMPAGALDADKGLWRTLRKSTKDGGGGYLFNHKALAKVFRAKLLATLAEAGLPLPADCPEKWVVDCKWRHHWLPERPGHLSLARQQDQKTVQRTVSGAAFPWLMLQHVLSKGFRRSRNFGFLHPNSKRLIALLKLLVFKQPGVHPSQPPTPATTPTPRPQLLCTCCGAPMVIVRRRILPSIAEPPTPKPGVNLGT